MENEEKPQNSTPTEAELTAQAKADDIALIEEIRTQVMSQCTVSKYTHLCQRISTQAGLSNVINRCIRMMADDGLELSSALALLESEYEGMN